MNLIIKQVVNISKEILYNAKKGKQQQTQIKLLNY